LTSESFNELFTIILTGKRPSLEKIPPPLVKVMEKMWDNNPQNRPTFKEAAEMINDARLEVVLPSARCPHAAKFWNSSWKSDLETTVENFLEKLFAQQLC